jgi:hypothetical protein
VSMSDKDERPAHAPPSGGRRAFYRWDLTPHERAALLTVLSDYIGRPDAIEVSVDAATGGEIAVSDLLAVLLQIEPTVER